MSADRTPPSTALQFLLWASRTEMEPKSAGRICLVLSTLGRLNLSTSNVPVLINLSVAGGWWPSCLLAAFCR